MIAITHQVSPAINRCELTFIRREPINLERAQAQHQRYCQALENLGVEVIVLSQNTHFPDACFVEDTAIVLDEIAIICRPGAASRQAETELIAKTLRPYRQTHPVDAPATLDGGDVLKVGKTLLVGLSSRTNHAGIKTLKKISEPWGYQVIPVKTQGSLHLKTACTALNDDTLFLNPAWIDTTSLKGFCQIAVPPEEPWAANILRVGEIIYVQKIFQRSLELVQKQVPKVFPLDTSELAKAEGALTCLSLLFN